MSLSLHSDEPGPRDETGEARTGPVVIVALLVLVLAGVGFLAWQLHQRSEGLERRVADLTARADEADSRSQQALERAAAAEGAARMAEQGRESAELEMARARQESEAARTETEAARLEAAGEREKAAAAREKAAAEREKAARAQAEAERIKSRAEAELNRMQDALSQIAETRRTALGLVMNLGGDHLKFAFDKAELRPEDRELLSRIAGILSTATDYTISVNGHTDDVTPADFYDARDSERALAAAREVLAAVVTHRKP